MGAYKDKGGRWYVSVRYKNWLGEPSRKTKRGFTTKRDALAWEREFLQKSAGSLDMTFNSFYEVYQNDLQNRIRQSTWVTKSSIIEKKILPYFGNKRVRDVKPVDVLHWQNTIMETTDENGILYSPVYLKTIHNQLSAMFNHAVRFYGLPENPAAKAGNMGKEKCGEVLVWTKDEYLQFIDTLKDKPASYYAFETLYWCGLRLGEMLALTPADFDFERKIIHVTKSFQRIKGEDIITPPKTEKGIRRVLMPDFYADKMRSYIESLQLNENDRIFPFTKSYLHHEIRRGCAASGAKRIRIHGIRHSHISLLIDMGFSAVAIADRVGHESIDITYRYAHVFPSTQQEVASKLNSMESNSIANETVYLEMHFDKPQKTSTVYKHYNKILEILSFLTNRENVGIEEMYLLQKNIPIGEKRLTQKVAQVFIRQDKELTQKQQYHNLEFECLGDSLGKLFDIFYKTKERKRSYLLGFYPEDYKHDTIITNEIVRSVCSALECEVGYIKGIKNEEEAKIKALKKKIQPIIEEHKAGPDKLKEKTYSLIESSMSHWSTAAADQFKILYHMYEEEMAAANKSQITIGDAEIDAFVKYRNDITHGSYRVLDSTIAYTTHLMACLVYCCVLTRIGIPREAIKQWFKDGRLLR